MSIKVLEWHCGIGGASAALGSGVDVIAAVDININAISVYRQNFPSHRAIIKNIESLTPEQVAAWGSADFWWASPPCQPHTVLGNRLDMADPRSASLDRLLRLIDALKPPALAMENVPGFATSLSRNLVCDCLTKNGYTFSEEIICPSAHGWPNRRNRYYLAASRNSGGLIEPLENTIGYQNLNSLIDPTQDDNKELWLDQAFLERYRNAIHIADRSDTGTITNCFTSAYGRSPTRCGSYLQMGGPDHVRRFSPREILALLHFPENYQLPHDMPPRRLWPLVGNSLALGAVRRTLSRIAILRPIFEPN